MGTVPGAPADPTTDPVASQEQEQPAVPPVEVLSRPIAVEVTNQPRTQELPNILGGIDTLTVEAAGRRILATDLRRSRALIWVVGNTAVLLARSQADAAALGGQLTPAGPVAILTSALGPIEYTGRDEVYAASTVAGTPALVCVIAEQWTQ